MIKFASAAEKGLQKREIIQMHDLMLLCILMPVAASKNFLKISWMSLRFESLNCDSLHQKYGKA